jgi:hypothetical protein
MTDQQIISNICMSILNENKLEDYLQERIKGVQSNFSEEEKVFLEILVENIDEFDLKFDDNLRKFLQELKLKYGVQ